MNRLICLVDKVSVRTNSIGSLENKMHGKLRKKIVLSATGSVILAPANTIDLFQHAEELKLDLPQITDLKMTIKPDKGNLGCSARLNHIGFQA
jgi:hypothetical protein